MRIFFGAERICLKSLKHHILCFGYAQKIPSFSTENSPAASSPPTEPVNKSLNNRGSGRSKNAFPYAQASSYYSIQPIILMESKHS